MVGFPCGCLPPTYSRNLETNISQMKNNSIISAVPLEWKKQIKNISEEDKLSFTRLNNKPYINQ